MLATQFLLESITSDHRVFQFQFRLLWLLSCIVLFSDVEAQVFATNLL